MTTQARAVRFKVTELEAERIKMIVERAERRLQGVDRLQLTMDITAVHANGCPLDLPKLLHAPDFDFAHDIWGIHRHLDRTTGKLSCFLPRCARTED